MLKVICYLKTGEFFKSVQLQKTKNGDNKEFTLIFKSLKYVMFILLLLIPSRINTMSFIC